MKESNFKTNIRTFPRVRQMGAFMDDEDLANLRAPIEAQHVEHVEGEEDVVYGFDRLTDKISTGRDAAISTGNTNLQNFLKKVRESQP